MPGCFFSEGVARHRHWGWTAKNTKVISDQIGGVILVRI